MTSIFNLSQISITFIKNLQKIYSIFLYKKLKSFFAKVQRITRVYVPVLKLKQFFAKRSRLHMRVYIHVLKLK